MKVALVMPNFSTRAEFGDISDPPIGIASIAGFLERRGHEVMIIDGMGEDLPEDTVLGRLLEFRPGAVGISCNYCILHDATVRLARRMREVLGDHVPVFAGGNHAAALADVLLGQAGGSIDCIARGEGELITLSLLEAVEAGAHLSKVPGIAYMENGGVITNPAPPLIPNLDILGLPAYHLLPMDKYRRYNIVSMRGCPYACSFCASTVLFGRKVRYRSPEKVVEEIQHLHETYGDRPFWFSDDTFTVNRAHTFQLLGMMRERGVRVRWSCLTTVTDIGFDLLDAMKAADCQYVSYGVESGSREMLNRMGKRITVEEILRTSRATRAAGLPHYGFFIVGFPGERWETVYDTYRLILESELDGGGMNVLIPLPGTRLWKTLFEERKTFTIEEMRWEELFARLPDEGHTAFPAELASRWCSLSAGELAEACRTGSRLFQLGRHMRGFGGSPVGSTGPP